MRFAWGNRCRAVFEARFTASRMAEEYVAIYERLVDGRTRRLAA